MNIQKDANTQQYKQEKNVNMQQHKYAKGSKYSAK